MNCPTCGSLNKGNSLICVACGHPLESLRSAIGTPLPSSKPQRLMIFIDAANIERQARDIGIMRVPWHLIRDQLRGDDTLVGAYYYTGTDLRVEGFRQQLDYLVTHGFRVVHKRSKELPGGGYKGNLDIEMSLDMLDFVGFYDKAFALTGDGDFIPVFSRLRDRGVQVMVGNFGVGSDASLKLVADGSLNLGLLLSMVIEQEKRRTEQSRFDQPELPLGETLDTHVDRNMLAGRLYSLGRNAFDRDELTQALNLFSQSVRLMPRHVRYHHWLALTLAALGRYADAANELEDLVRQEVEDAEVLYDLGQVYEKLGAPDKALEAYARCSSLDSRYKDVQTRKQELERSVKSSNGQATGQRGRGTRSRQAAAPARSPRTSTGSARTESATSPARTESQAAPAPTESATPPTRTESQGESAPVARESGSRKRPQPAPSASVEAKGSEAPAATPSSASTGMALAFQHMLQGDHQQSVSALEQAAKLEPDNLDVALALAQQLAASGEHTRAAMMAEQLVLDNPENYAPIAVLGRICYERGKFRDALEQFTQALELAKQADDLPAQAFLYRMVVWTHLESGNEAEALAASEAGRAAAPEDQQLRRLVDRVKGAQAQQSPASPSPDGESDDAPIAAEVPAQATDGAAAEPSAAAAGPRAK
jgi:tetratricopeptide (TPR) repeat protein